MIMDAQDIIELIEYFRTLQDNEMKYEIEERKYGSTWIHVIRRII